MPPIDAAGSKPGPPLDTDAREDGVALGEQIDASSFSIADVCRMAGLTSYSAYSNARQALRGTKTNRPAIAKLRAAFERLTAEPARS